MGNVVFDRDIGLHLVRGARRSLNGDDMMSAIMGIVGGAAALAGIFVSEKGSS